MEFEAFYFVRHGESEANRAGLVAGADRDSPLTEAGISAARSLAEPVLRLPDISTIFCSPMRRAQETARQLNNLAHKTIVTVSDLREWHVGTCDDKPMKDYAPLFVSWTYDPPGGETRAQLEERAENALSACRQQSGGRPFLIVAHAGIWWAMARFLRLCQEEMVHNTTLIRLEKDATGWRQAPAFMPR